MSEGGELVWGATGRVGPKDVERHTVPLLQPGVYHFYLKKTESVKAPTRIAQAELRVFDDQGSVIFERSWKAIGGLDSPKDPTKARVSFDLLSEHLASRPGSLEIVVRSNVIVGKLSYRTVLTRRLRLVPTSPQTSPRSSPRLPGERGDSTRKQASVEPKERRVSMRKSGQTESAILGTISNLLSNNKNKPAKRDVLAIDPVLDACLRWFERSSINEHTIASLGISPRTPEELARLKEDVERGEKEDFPASYGPETILEFLRQWSTTAESIIPLSLADCLILAYRQSDFQAQRGAFATLATHLPARNYATLRRLALFFRTMHIHPSVFLRAGIPLDTAIMRPYWKENSSGSARDGQVRLEAAAKILGVLVDEYEFIFENPQLEHDASEGCQRISEKDRIAFFRDLRQGCLFLGLKVSEKFIKESQRKTVVIAPLPREPTPKPLTEAPESPKKNQSPRASGKVESPRKADSPRKSDAIKPRTHLVKCSGCDGEMQIVIIDGKIYHASCSPITTPPKPSPTPPPSYTSASVAVVSRHPSASLSIPSTNNTVSDTIYAPLPSLPRHSEPGVQAAKANMQEGTSMSAPIAPNPLRSAILPSQDDLLRAMSEESKDKDRDRDLRESKEKDRDLRESKEKDPSDKGHKRQPSWTHASPSVRISSRAGQLSRDSGSNLSPVPKPPPPVAPAPTPSPDMLLQPILPASAASASPLSSTSSSTSVSASSSRSGSTRSTANIGSARPLSPPPTQSSSSSSTPATSTIVFPTIPPPATPPPATLPGADAFADDPDAAEIERLAELIEEGRFSDVEAYLLLLDQPQQVEARARKLSIVLARKLSESGPPVAKPR